MAKNNNIVPVSLVVVAALVMLGRPVQAFANEGQPAQAEKQEDGHAHGKKDGHDHGKEAAAEHQEDGHHHGDDESQPQQKEADAGHGEEGHDHGKEETAEEGHSDEHGHGHEEGPTDRTKISDAAAKASGIAMLEAGPAKVSEYVALTGYVAINQNKMAVVKGRFPGVVRDVKKTQGEAVKAGEILASVESNESLQVYSVKAPIDGMILSRNTNIGDVAGDAVLFTIADINELWAELHIFPQNIGKVKPGMDIILSSSECADRQEAKIISTLPIIEASTQTLLARVNINNLDDHWSPGMSVRGDVVVNSREVPLAVKTSAIQRMEGQQVVFVKEGENYIMRPVKIGMGNKEWTEIIEGLKPGEKYVSEGGFTVKADIGKAGAEHAH